MKPRSAQMRQQQSQARRIRVEESAARAHMMSAGAGRGSPYAGLGFNTHRDPTRGVITNAEWDEMVEQRANTGGGFRYFFIVMIILGVLLLLFSKYDAEYNIDVPSTVHAWNSPSDQQSNDSALLANLDEYYRTLDVKGRLNMTLTAPSAIPSGANYDPDKQRRRDNFRVRKELKRVYTEHLNKSNQLVHCGRSCEAQNKQVELAYNTLTSQVDRELFGVLLDAKDTKSVRTTSPDILAKKYAEKRAHILETEQDEEDREMALEELKDAYDIIQDPDARKYYVLFGVKPPAFMRHVSARHGGWGQEIALGTYKYRMIIMWLDYLHQYLGLWGETGVLLIIVVFVLLRLPAAMKQSVRVLEDLDIHLDDLLDEDKAQSTENTDDNEENNHVHAK